MNEDCPHCVFEITEANCRGCFEGSHYKPKQITNADSIRSLSDTQLALFLYWLVDGSGRTLQKWEEWLKKEAKE